VYTLFPILFAHSLLQLTLHSLLTLGLSIATLWNFSLAVLTAPGSPPPMAPRQQSQGGGVDMQRVPQGGYRDHRLCVPCHSAVRPPANAPLGWGCAVMRHAQGMAAAVCTGARGPEPPWL
jgi:hypothetical protein